jgi:hypothetical protein
MIEQCDSCGAANVMCGAIDPKNFSDNDDEVNCRQCIPNHKCDECGKYKKMIAGKYQCTNPDCPNHIKRENRKTKHAK